MALYLGSNPVELYTAGQANGLTAYLHIRYAAVDPIENEGTVITNSPTGAKYIGFCANYNYRAPTDANLYGWSLITQDRDYLHIAYADDINGTNATSTYYAGASTVAFAITNSPSTPAIGTFTNWLILNLNQNDFASKQYVAEYITENIDNISEVQINSTALEKTNGVVNIDLSNYALASELGTASEKTLETTGIQSNTDTVPTTAQVKEYVDSNHPIETVTVNSIEQDIDEVTKTLDIDLTEYIQADLTDTLTPVTTTNITNADTLSGHSFSELALKTDLVNYVSTSDGRLNDARTPLTHTHSIGQVTDLNSTLAGKSNTNHTHATLTNGIQVVSLPSSLAADDTFVLQSDLNNKITVGTSAMTAGVSTLAAGTFYFQYEE